MKSQSRVRSIIIDVFEAADGCGDYLQTDVYFKFDGSERTYAALDFNGGDMANSPMKEEIVALTVAIKAAIKKNEKMKVLGGDERKRK